MRIKKIERNNFYSVHTFNNWQNPQNSQTNVALVEPNGSGKTFFMEFMNHSYKFAGCFWDRGRIFPHLLASWSQYGIIWSTDRFFEQSKNGWGRYYENFYQLRS